MAQEGFTVFIYTQAQPAEHREKHPEHSGLSVIHLSDEKEFVLMPFRGEEESSVVYGAESSRLNFLILRSTIDRQIRKCSRARHIIISFYVSGTGFVAQNVAASLALPHIASVRGTDFGRDIHSVPGHPKIRHVVENASQVVTTNREQADGLSAVFRIQRPIRTIHNALPNADGRPFWELPESDTVRLISDCGFSGRKATHLLLRAVGALIEKRLPVSLTILGGISWPKERVYWEERQSEYVSRYPGKFFFPGHLPRTDLDSHLLSAHLYCSATLSEGCSMSRVRALTIGIPIVTTRCGAIVEVAADCRHVRLCPPGDWAELASQLEAAVGQTRVKTLKPDRERVECWRKHFSIERERVEWRAVIEEVVAAR